MKYNIKPYDENYIEYQKKTPGFLNPLSDKGEHLVVLPRNGKWVVLDDTELRNMALEMGLKLKL